MERNDIISELEEVIVGGTSQPNKIIERFLGWMTRISGDGRYGETNSFYENLLIALKVVDAVLETWKNEDCTYVYLSFEGKESLAFSVYYDEYEYKIMVTKDIILMKYFDKNNTTYQFRYIETGKRIIVKDNESEHLPTQRKCRKLNHKLTEYIKAHKNDKPNAILHIIDRIETPASLYNIIYIHTFSKAFEIVCRSVLSGEYAMDDSFSKRIRFMSNYLRKISSLSPDISYSQNDFSYNSIYFFSPCAVALSQILDEYNLFCIQTDAQVDKDPSAILANSTEYYGYHQYEECLNKFLSNNTESEQEDTKYNTKDFLYVNPLLVHFFQSFLHMTRIDQNFFFSKERLFQLLYLKELLDRNTSDGKGIWRVWYNYQKTSSLWSFTYLEEMLHLINLKNNFLIAKIVDGCYDEVKNLIYVGQNNKTVFDPRKCYDIDGNRSGGNSTELLLLNGIKDRESELKDVLTLYSDFKGRKNNLVFDEYENEYIKAINASKANECASGLCKFYDEIIKSRTIVLSKDIRHYNTKVIEMAREAVFDTAEIRCWVKYHRHDFNENDGFLQIEKVLLFLQERYEGGTVCYDNEMLTDYLAWCLDFLEIVAKKTPIPNSNRPSQIEDALLLLETLNRLLDKLIKSIDGKKYCLPYSSKFRGCFFRYIKHNAESDESRRLVTHFDAEKYHKQLGNPEDCEKSGRLERVFTGQPENDSNNKIGKKDFGDFIAANEKYRETRKSIIFIASSYVPPLNYEKLKEESRSFVARTLKLRNEIHAEYFNRLREYIKEDSEKQLENNRRSVVQILGIFAAFLALTTVALSAANSESDLPFVTIMVGFTTCIVVFVALLYLLTHSKVQREYEVQRYQDKIFKQNVNKEILRFIHVVKNTISDVDNETERGVTKKVNAILDKETTNIKMQEDCLCKRSDFEERVEQIENKLDRIKHFKRGRYYLAKSWKIHPAEWIIIILLVVMTALTILLSINNEGKNNMSTVQIVTKLEAKSKDGKTKDNADITNNDKNHGNKNITEEGQNMEKEAESQKIISEQDPILDGGKKRVKEPVPEK